MTSYLLFTVKAPISYQLVAQPGENLKFST